MLGDFKIYLKNLVADNKIDNVFTELTQKIKESSLKYDDLISCKSSYNEIQKDEREGAISVENIQVKKNAFRKSLMHLINSLEQEDLKAENKQVEKH